MLARAALNLGLRHAIQQLSRRSGNGSNLLDKVRGKFGRKERTAEHSEAHDMGASQAEIMQGPWTDAQGAQPLPRASLKPLMQDAEMELFYWLSDELEMASPNLSLHAGVSVATILSVSGPLPDSLRETHIDLLIVDEAALPVAAILFDDEDSARIDDLATILERAELPALLVDPEEDPNMIWDELLPLIEYEIAA